MSEVKHANRITYAGLSTQLAIITETRTMRFLIFCYRPDNFHNSRRRQTHHYSKCHRHQRLTLNACGIPSSIIFPLAAEGVVGGKQPVVRDLLNSKDMNGDSSSPCPSPATPLIRSRDDELLDFLNGHIIPFGDSRRRSVRNIVQWRRSDRRSNCVDLCLLCIFYRVFYRPAVRFYM